MQHRSRSSSSLRSGSARSGSIGTRRKPIDDESTTNMKVFLRVRPLMEGEEGEGDPMRALKILPDQQSVYIKDRFVDEKVLTFNRVFGPDTRQKDVFTEVGLPACDAAISGQYGTVLAYGQTGTGKTYTAFNTTNGEEGLMVRCVHSIFEAIKKDTSHAWEVEVQYLQLYKEQISDLLSTEPSPVSIREDTERGVYVTGANNLAVNSSQEVLHLFEEGNKNRVVRLTTMNAQSSRSHALFRLSLKRRSKSGKILNGRLTLVDLAGSERIKRTKADSLRRQEAQSINMSLSCLGTVIHALTDNKSTHVPYRSCKLTRVLRDSLGEHGKASIVVTISPALADVAETLGSLYFGTRALCVKQSHKIHYTVDEDVLAEGLKQQVTDLTEGKTDLENIISNLAADNTQLREAANADETLIQELATQIKNVNKHQNNVVQLDNTVRKMQEREKAIERVMCEELEKQNEEYARTLEQVKHEMRAKFEEEKATMQAQHEEEVGSMRLIVEQVEDESREKISSLEREVRELRASRSPTPAEVQPMVQAIDEPHKHTEEVTVLRESLDLHRQKLEEAQQMLKMCKQERSLSQASSRATSPPTPLPFMGYGIERHEAVQYGSTSPPARDHVEATLQSMQEQLDEERSSVGRLKEEAEQLKKEKAEVVQRCMSLEACAKENFRMKDEKKEDRELLCSLIKERNSLQSQIKESTGGSPSPQVDVVDRVSQRLQELARARSASMESTNTDREPILGTFAVHVPPHEPSIEVSDIRTNLDDSSNPFLSSSFPSLDRLYSRTMIRNM